MSLPKLDALPVDIIESTRALVWRFETRDGKITKPPYQSRRPRQKAAVDDPRTWSPFAIAVDTVADGKADGVGVVLGEGLVGVDLDQCRDPETGVITPDALALIHSLDSYTEVSPSGTGIHILVRGVLPPGRRRKAGVECYSDRRYFTITGLHLPGTPTVIHERTAELATMHQEIFGPVPDPPTPPSPVESTRLTDAAVILRASTARNGSRFVALWNGDLSSHGGDESAADLALCNLLAFWTGRDADQIDRLFRQSRLMRSKWESRRGESTYGADTIAKAIADCAQTYRPGIEIDLETETAVASISMPVSDPIPAATTDVWPTLHDDALIGVFGDLVHAIAPCTEASPVALLGHALIFWGNLVGRTAHATVGSARHYLNEDLLIIGPTSSGRKGTAEAEIRPVMAGVDPVWAETRVVTGLSSGEGLIHQVRDPIEAQEPIKVHGRTMGYQSIVQDDGVSDKRLCVIETEFGKVLRVSRRDGNTLSPTMRQSWDSGDLRVMTRNSPIQATQAHVSLIAHVTPQELRSELRTVDMANGFINRFIPLLVRRSQFLPDGGRVDPVLLQSVIQRFAVATESARQTGHVTRDADAKAYWHTVYPVLTRDRSGLVGAICTRAPAHVLRLSLVYALADCATAVRIEHLKAALAVWAYAEHSIQTIFGAQTGHRLSDYLLAVLRSHPDGLTRTQLSDVLGRNRRADEIHEALQRLVDFGLVRSIKEPPAETGGRPVQRWFALTSTE